MAAAAAMVVLAVAAVATVAVVLLLVCLHSSAGGPRVDGWMDGWKCVLRRTSAGRSPKKYYYLLYTAAILLRKQKCNKKTVHVCTMIFYRFFIKQYFEVSIFLRNVSFVRNRRIECIRLL